MSTNSPEKGNWMTTGARLALLLILSSCADKPADLSVDSRDLPNKIVEDLIEIDLSNTPTSDISEYKGLPVKRVSLSYTDVKDISPLKGAPLEHLDIAFSLVKNLEALRGNTTLNTIDIRDTKIDDLSPLECAPLKMIFLSESATDLSPIKGAIEDGAIVHPPMEYMVDTKNWKLIRI